MVESELSLKHLTSPNFGKIPEIQNEAITSVALPHIESYNFMLEDGIKSMISLMPPIHHTFKNNFKLKIVLKDLIIDHPTVTKSEIGVAGAKLLPRECIGRSCSYVGKMTGVVDFTLNNQQPQRVDVNFGKLPIMVKSKRCHLENMSPKELVKHGELAQETGGYFIINGALRLIRQLIVNRRNYPMAIQRDAWKKKSIDMTGKGVMIRCVADDQSACMNILHYLTSGAVKVEMRINKKTALFPLMFVCMALDDRCGGFMYESLMRGREHDEYQSEKIMMMMRNMVKQGLLQQAHVKKFIGEHYRYYLRGIVTDDMTDEEACDVIFERHLFIHLKTKEEKFNLLCHMVRKLYGVVAGTTLEESTDVISMQESTMGGHIMLQCIAFRIKTALFSTYKMFEAYIRKSVEIDRDLVTSVLHKTYDVGRFVESFLSTGRLPYIPGSGLSQDSGLTIVIDHLNRLRDLSHFKAVHRGTFFVTLATMEPRRLTGDAWGFICPIHTPDGQNCGLLNHMTANCVVTNGQNVSDGNLVKTLVQYGVTPVSSFSVSLIEDFVDVLVDGNLIGYVQLDNLDTVVSCLRKLKVDEVINKYTEIVTLKPRRFGSQHPSLVLFTTAARMMRPVMNLQLGLIEYIGSFEQLYLDIATSRKDYKPGVHAYMEIDDSAILSNVARLVPFLDCNPSPRNIYQCQMAKQTMGTPIHNYGANTAQKLYKLQTPQVPLVRNSHYDTLNMEEFCLGFNAVVAIISYTGYDMEDAIVINKQSMERGFAHGQIYKSEHIDLSLKETSTTKVEIQFKRDPENAQLEDFLDEDGLPKKGKRLEEGDPYYCTFTENQGTYSIAKYKGEPGFVDNVSIMDADTKKGFFQKAHVVIRSQRNPVVGDKFASRSGQKGIMSYLSPIEDLPFSERGIVPDIIFNPHSIPSRMTCGKLLEVLAGKSAAEIGKSFNSSPFNYDDNNPAYDYFGQILEQAGFNYYGEDILYSGTNGRMLECSIFEGVVYYQRLRHMVDDKFQVRATGAVDAITQQPVQGRKRGGAIRFGEMERDCLISHGAAFLLKDRMLDCSDATTDYVCSKCGCTVAPRPVTKIRAKTELTPSMMICALCGPGTEIRHITIPFALKCLVVELASLGIQFQALTDKPAVQHVRTGRKKKKNEACILTERLQAAVQFRFNM